MEGRNLFSIGVRNFDPHLQTARVKNTSGTDELDQTTVKTCTVKIMNRFWIHSLSLWERLRVRGTKLAAA
jgi:hypothetical protein